MEIHFDSMVQRGNKLFYIKYIHGLGWKLYDETAGKEVRNIHASNGLYVTKHNAMKAIETYVTALELLYGKM